MSSQTLITILNAVFGIMVARALSFHEYSHFVLVYSIQGMCVVLMDLGVTGAVIPLVGARVDDSQLIADYVASAKRMMRVMFGVASVISVASLYWLIRNTQASWFECLVLALLLVSGIYASRVAVLYGVVLIVKRDRQNWLAASRRSAWGTLLILMLLLAMHCNRAGVLLAVNLSGVCYVAWSYSSRSVELLACRGKVRPELQKNIRTLTLPSIPSIVFYAIQGQLLILLMSAFGKSEGIAGIGALGRFGQVYTTLGQINPVLIEPYFARLPKAKVKMAFLAVLGSAVLLSCIFVGLSSIFPNVFLWVLGPKYAGISHELVLVFIAGGIAYVGSVMSSVNCARCFNYYSMNLLNVVGVLTVDALYIKLHSMNTLESVLHLGILSAIPPVVIVLLTFVYGMTRRSREGVEC